MRKTNKFISLIVGILFIIAGIIALADLIKIPMIIGILLGAAAAIQGLRIVWLYIRTEDKSGFRPNIMLAWGILLLVLAVFLFVNSTLASALAIYLVGAWFVAEAVASFFTLRLLDANSKIVSVILSLLILAGGAVLILHQPLKISTEMITLPIAITLILDGISISLLASLRRDPPEGIDPFGETDEAPRLKSKN